MRDEEIENTDEKTCDPGSGSTAGKRFQNEFKSGKSLHCVKHKCKTDEMKSDRVGLHNKKEGISFVSTKDAKLDQDEIHENDTMAKNTSILFRTKLAHQPRNEDFEFDGDITTGSKRNDIESSEMYLSKKKINILHHPSEVQNVMK